MVPLNCPGHVHRSGGPRLGVILASQFWRSRIWGPTCDGHLISPTETPSDSDHKKKKKKKEEDPERKRKKKEKKKKKVWRQPVQAARESLSRPGPRESRLLFLCPPFLPEPTQPGAPRDGQLSGQQQQQPPLRGRRTLLGLPCWAGAGPGQRLGAQAEAAPPEEPKGRRAGLPAASAWLPFSRTPLPFPGSFLFTSCVQFV